jgi:cytochrome c biogenesis protein CcdA/thiol-disulfide isomerase/thioredoxin
MSSSGWTSGSPPDRRPCRFVRLALLACVLLLLPISGLAADAPKQLDLYVFYGDGCPHCAEQAPFLDELASRYPGLNVHRLEVWQDATHHPTFEMLARMYGIDAGAVPTVFVGDGAFIGDAPHIRRAIEAIVARELAPRSAPASLEGSTSPTQLELPLIGTIDLAAQPLLLMTLAVGLVDGVNPCSLWVLTLLLGLVIRSGSRARLAAVGLSFLATTSLVYAGFMAGLMSVMGIIGHLGWLRWLVAAFAIGMGTIDIKDYFSFRRGVTRRIAEQQKPGLYARLRLLMDPARSGPLLVGTTVIVAGAAALVELPCTMGFPLVWNGILLEHGVSRPTYLLLLAVYLLVYLLDELVIFAAALLTLRMTRLAEQHGRVLKLIGGSVMLALGSAMLIRPQVINDMNGLLAVFAMALLAAGGLALLQRLLGGQSDTTRSALH